jgi:hypothetical protein
VFIPDIDVASTSASVEAAWHQYCLKWDDKPSKTMTKFHGNLFRGVVSFSHFIDLCLSSESLVYEELRKLHMIKLSYYFDAADLRWFVAELMVKYS